MTEGKTPAAKALIEAAEVRKADQALKNARAEAAKWQKKAQAQRNRIGQLEKQAEEDAVSKRDHVFRLRQLIYRALHDHPAWREDAQRELRGRG